MSLSVKDRYSNRARRNRTRLRRVANTPLRLSVFRASKNIYAQIIDDERGVTLAAASSRDESLKGTCKGSDKASAEAVGKLLAEKAKKANVGKVYFDRGAYLYHGRVKALGDAARAAGLQF